MVVGVTKRVNFRKNVLKNLLLRNHKGDEAETCHTCLRTLASTKVVFFYSGRIRTLVAMATYSSHRLIKGKEEIDNFFCLIGDIWIFFKEMFIE